MASLRRVTLVLILVVTSMGVVSVRGWDLWDPFGRWSSAENDSAPWEGLGGINEAPEDEQTPSDNPLSSTTYRLDTASGFYDQSTTDSNYFPDVPNNDTFSGSDEDGELEKGDEESKGFTNQLYQKTMDFFSGLLSPSETGTDEFNSTEIDNLQPNEYNLCRDGNTFPNCSSDPITPDPQLQDIEIEEPDGNYPSTASTDPPTPSEPSLGEPTWIDASPSCLLESIDRSVGKCDWGEERTLEGVLVAVFNDTIVKRLVKKCTPGDWCLRKHFSKHQTRAEQRSCGLLLCLDDWKDDNCQPSNVIWNALYLLCTLTNVNTSDDCVISVLKMLHVTIADMIRVTVQPEDEELICSKGEDKEGCRGPCQKVGQNLQCMSASCDNNTLLFEGFAEWQWLFGKIDAVEKCPFNSSDCQLFETHSVMTSHDNDVLPHHSPRHLLTFLKNNEWPVIAGLTLSVLFSLLVVCGIFLGLRCSGRRRLRQRVLRHKAMARDDGGGLTRDRIQYTIITTQQDDFDDQDSDDNMT